MSSIDFSSIDFKEGQEGMVIVNYINGMMLGSLAKQDDGYYVFFPSIKGSWSEYIMQAICDKLKNLNAAWDLQVEAVLAVQPKGVPEDGLDD